MFLYNDLFAKCKNDAPKEVYPVQVCGGISQGSSIMSKEPSDQHAYPGIVHNVDECKGFTGDGCLLTRNRPNVHKNYIAGFLDIFEYFVVYSSHKHVYKIAA